MEMLKAFSSAIILIVLATVDAEPEADALDNLNVNFNIKDPGVTDNEEESLSQLANTFKDQLSDAWTNAWVNAWAWTGGPPMVGPYPIPERPPMVGPYPIPERPPMVGPYPIAEVPPMMEPYPIPEIPPMVEPYPIPEVPPTDGPYPIPEIPPSVKPSPIPERPPLVGPNPIPERPPMVGPYPIPERPPMVGPYPIPERPPMVGPYPIPETPPMHELPTGPLHGRPFIVDGKSRTTSSKTCTNSGGIHEILTESWRQGRDPSVRPDGPYNQDIGMYWLRQAEGEHTSVASFARHTLQLMSIGAPARLLVASQEASLDEIKHAKMCYGIASAFLVAGTGPRSLDVTGSLENMNIKEIVQSVIVEGCIGETLSAIEAHFAAHYAQDGAVKEALEEIAADETRHGQLAWDTIEWILQKQPEIRNYVNDVFEEEFEKLIIPARNDTDFHGSLFCEESDKEIIHHSFGLLDEDDRSKVREVGLRDIIEPVYRDGIINVDIISKRIIEMNINDLIGLPDEDDRRKVREVELRDIIEPLYRDGIENVNIIS